MPEISKVLLEQQLQQVGPGVTPIKQQEEDVSLINSDASQASAIDENEAYNNAIREAIADETNIIDGQIRSEAAGDADKFVEGQSAGEVPWCAAYVNYVLEDSGVETAQWYKDVSQDNNRDGVEDSWTVKYTRQAAENAGAMIGANQSQIGDLCFLSANHMGVVGKVEEDGTICVVTGNSADQVQAYMIQPEQYGQYAFANTSGTDRANVNNAANAPEVTTGPDGQAVTLQGDKGVTSSKAFTTYDPNNNADTGYYYIDDNPTFQDYILEKPTVAPEPTPQVTATPSRPGGGGGGGGGDDYEPTPTTAPTAPPTPSDNPTTAPTETPPTPTEGPTPTETPPTPTEGPTPTETPPTPTEGPTSCPTGDDVPVTPDNPPITDDIPNNTPDTDAPLEEDTKPEEKPETKPEEPQPEPQPEEKPETKPEEPQPEPQPEEKPETGGNDSTCDELESVYKSDNNIEGNAPSENKSNTTAQPENSGENNTVSQNNANTENSPDTSKETTGTTESTTTNTTASSSNAEKEEKDKEEK